MKAVAEKTEVQWEEVRRRGGGGWRCFGQPWAQMVKRGSVAARACLCVCVCVCVIFQPANENI